MSPKFFTQSRFYYILIGSLLAVVLGLTACGGAPAPTRPAEPVVVEKEVEKIAEQPAEAPKAEATAAPAADQANTASLVSNNQPNVYNRLIIKNAEVALLVEDTDTAINRSLGIITDYGGYVVSNRTWIQDNYKYATLTIGVPAENFEEMLRRLKAIAIAVTNETASGQDVTDEFVDLKSRLTNLEATAARMREFLNQAKTVQESLDVNAKLAEIEGQIEEVKGRMTYLKERAAFSTITLQIAPQIPMPPPPPIPTPTPTPTATPTSEPWTPGRTFNQATTVTSHAATSLFQVTVDLLIWLVIVILPFALPIVAVIWLASRLARWWGRSTLPPAA